MVGALREVHTPASETDKAWQGSLKRGVGAHMAEVGVS